MKTINHESDFKLKVGYSDGSPISEPFRFTFYTKVSRGTFIAEYNGSEYVNCYPDGGMVKIPFDKPMLGMGVLSVKIELFINDSDFADGKYDYVSEERTGIILDKGATEPYEDMEVLISKPNTRGLQMFLSKPFTEGGGGGEKGEDGKSAYDIWLEQGNSGSEQDFLDSLKGEKGDQGEQGIQGEKGEKGDKMTYDDLTEAEKDDLASRVEVPAPDVDLSEYAKSSDVQSAIEEVNAKIDMYKEATIDFGTGEDTVTMAIMESGTTITKVKMKNVKTLYLSYGNVTKAEYVGGEVPLGNADFLVMTIIRTASDVDAVVGLTLR